MVKSPCPGINNIITPTIKRIPPNILRKMRMITLTRGSFFLSTLFPMKIFTGRAATIKGRNKRAPRKRLNEIIPTRGNHEGREWNMESR
jgi:hypothetical protein